MAEDDQVVDDKNKSDPPADPPKDPPADPPKDPPTPQDDKGKKDDPTPDDPPKDPPENDEPKSWGDTGTDVGNSVLTVLQESGLEVSKAKELLYDAVQSGDPSKIDEAALTEAMGSAAQARIVVSGIRSHVKEISTRAQEIKTSLYDEVGSEENWSKLSTWAKETLSDSDLQDYMELVGQGGRKAKLAARDLMEQYEEAGNTSLKDRTTVPSKTAKTTSTEQPLSRKEYFDAMEKAQREGKLNESTKAKLWKQRQAGVQAGK